MALKKESAEAIAAALGLDATQLTEALASENEVEIEVPTGLFIPETEKEAFVTRLKKEGYNEGKVAGVEMEVKRLKEQFGIQKEGKSIDVLLDGFKEKITTEIKTPTDEKVKTLTSQMEELRKTYTTDLTHRDGEIQKLQQQLKDNQVNSTLRSHVPEGLKGLNPDQFLHVTKLEYQFDVDDSGQLVAKKGNEIVTDKLQKPRPVREILTEYAVSNGWIAKEGRAGGNEPGGSSTTFKTMHEVQKHMHINGIDPMSSEGQRLVKEFKEAQQS
jgi:hypothetical protein